MSPSSLFIHRPVMTTLVMVGILVFGIFGYLALPVSDLPNVDSPFIQVTAGLPGANPETMAAAVATPLERQFSTIAGIDSMISSSTLGSTQIVIQFALTRSIDGAALDVNSAITAALKQLPPGMPTPPTFQKVNPADSPILYLALHSDVLPLSTVDEFGESMLAQRISMVDGVAQVMVYGSQKFAVRAQMDPDRMAAHGVTFSDVNAALANGNVNLPTGVLYGHHQAATVVASGQLQNAAAYKPLVVAWRNGAPVRLGDLGNVVDSVQNTYVANWFGMAPEGDAKAPPGEASRSVVLAILRQPGTNTVQIVDSVKKLLPNFQTRLPASLHLDVLFDRSIGIRSSVEDVQHTLIITAVLVILVIFAFLRAPTATIIPSLSLPMSLIGTFAAMHVLGYNLDNLSLMALTLSTGFVVDDGIVVLENIMRRIEEGESVKNATERGAAQIGFTVLSMTLSLAAVFIPLLFMGGQVGRLFREFSITIVCSILISGFISLTLTPMLCSRFLKAHQPGGHNLLFRLSEHVFDAMHAFYRVTLGWAMRMRILVLILAVASVGVTAYMFRIIPTGLFPPEDLYQIIGRTDAGQDVSFEEMVRHQKALTEIVGKNPNIAAFMSAAGNGGANQGFVFMRLKDHNLRTATPEQVIAQLRAATANVPGIRIIFQNPPAINVSGRGAKGLWQYTLQGTDLAEIEQVGPQVESSIRGIPGVVDVSTDLQLSSPRLNVVIDRDKASSLGITAGDIETTLAAAYGSGQVSTIYTDSDEFWVILETEPQFQLDPAALGKLYLRSSTGANAGALIPLSTVVHLERSSGPLIINHQGQLPAVTISFNLADGAAIGPIVEKIKGLNLPASITGTFQGNAQAFQASLQGMGVLLFLAIAVIYLVLGCLYESFIHPITILSGLPAAGIGALATLMIFHIDLNIYSFVGIIMLIGIVKKNAIMMIDFAIQNRHEGKTAEEAIVQGALVRFRPIMMTTFAALMGTLPIALGIGGSSNSRRDLGMAVVGGLVLSQFITLYITPVIYLYLDGFEQWLSGGKGKAAVASHVVKVEHRDAVQAPTPVTAEMN